MKRLIKYAFSMISVALCLLIFLAGCRKNPETTKGPAEKITFACAMHPGSLLVQIADKFDKTLLLAGVFISRT